MAKNLFEQFIDLVSYKWPEPAAQDVSRTATEATGGLTGVAKYLAKQGGQETPELTGVEKYLARQTLTETVKPEATGVERYLARQALSVAEAAKPLTGVEKYLAKQATSGKPAKKLSRVEKYLAKQSVTEKISVKATGVAKYLGKQGSAEKKTNIESELAQTVSPEVETEALIAGKADKPKAETHKKTATPTQEAKAAQAEKQKPAKPAILNLAKDATQCQASTAKGTQCSRTVNLTLLQRTIDKQKYQFAVCSQHNTSSFKPYAALINK